MSSINIGLNTFIILNSLLLLIGLFKPHMVLWWENRQYRMKVILVYGSVIGITLVIKVLLKLFF